MTKPTLLCILDGWGISGPTDGNAIHLADTPNMDRYLADRPNGQLITHGPRVGLPDGQFGNSEVGHLTIGAGRVIEQTLVRINAAVKQDQFSQMPEINAMINRLNKTGQAAHVMGLLSPGGVHSHIDHVIAMVNTITAQHITVNLHVILDGRDVMPKTAVDNVSHLNTRLNHPGRVHIQTISGRYYTMDRDQRWDRTKKAFDGMVYGDGPAFGDPVTLIKKQYTDGVTDEFIPPHVANGYQGVEAGDALIACNFRADRMRQILRALTKSDFTDFDRGQMAPPNWSKIIGMVKYADDLADEMDVLFPPVQPDNTLGQVISQHGSTQLRLAESEKYPHVTYFLNGGLEDAFDGEQRIIVPSPDVATYDQCPQMSAGDVTNRCIDYIHQHLPDFIVLNFANPDMVGHTGDLQAAIQAVETVDHCLGQVIDTIKEHHGQALIIADHGNCEQMKNPDTGQPHSAHTTNPVPCVYIGDQFDTVTDGGLADVAPTVLHMMSIARPDAMDGQSLLS